MIDKERPPNWWERQAAERMPFHSEQLVKDKQRLAELRTRQEEHEKEARAKNEGEPVPGRRDK